MFVYFLKVRSSITAPFKDIEPIIFSFSNIILELSLIALLASALPFGAFWLGSWRGLLGLTAGLVMVQGLALTTAVAP